MAKVTQHASHLIGIVRAERLRGFEGLAGSRAEVTLPVRQAVLDAALAQVRAWPPAVERVAIDIGDANCLHVTATVRVLGFRTPVRLQLRLAPSMEEGIVRLVIDDGSIMGSAVTLLGPLLGTLPEGVRLQGRQISVDVRRLAAQQGVEDLASLVSTATFQANRGVLWITLQAVAPATEPGQPRVARLSSSANALPIDVGALLTWLQGARVAVDMRMDERLANDLLVALHADAQTPSGDERRDVATRALQPPVVRFEAGALRLSAAAALDSADDAGN